MAPSSLFASGSSSTPCVRPQGCWSRGRGRKPNERQLSTGCRRAGIGGRSGQRREGLPVTTPSTARFVPSTRAGAELRRSASPEITRHLVLAFRPGWQSMEDLTAIARHVQDIDPATRTFVLPGTNANNVSRRAAAALPTLIVSPGPLSQFKPLRGKVYQGFPVPKFEEIRRLAEAGVPVPRTVLLTPELRLDPSVWGDLVVLKPTDHPS